MSLLMDALRKAEESKRLAGEAKTPVATSDLALEAIGEPLMTSAPPSAARSRLPDLSLHSEALDAELSAIPGQAPSQRQARADRPLTDGTREAQDRGAARNVFAAKQPPAAHSGLWLIIGFGVLAALAIAVYFWWQLQSVPSELVARPQSAPPLAAVPAAPRSSAPAPPAQPMPHSDAAPPASEALLTAPARPVRPLPPPASSEARAVRSPRLAANTAPPADGQLRLSRSVPKTSATIERAYAGLDAGRLDDARRDYESVLGSDPKNTDALLGLATIAARQGHNESAQALYLRALEADPNDATAQAGLLNARGQADPAAAESRLKNVLASHPDSSALHFALGKVYGRQQRWSEAQQAYFKAYGGDPDNADVIFNLAVSLDHLRQNKLAAQYYQMALDAAASHGRVVSFDRSQVSKRIGALWP